MPTQSSLLKELHQLQPSADFVHRHIGPNQTQQQAMLQFLELQSLEDLLEKTVPHDILQPQSKLDLKPASEEQALNELKSMMEANQLWQSFLGQGYYGTYLPAVIRRNLLENPGWYTAYTPYQAEIAQGRLEALLNFQQMVLDLTAMEVANASLLDEATAAAEAMTLCQRHSKKKSNQFFVDRNVHRQTLDLLQTRAEPMNIQLVVGEPAEIPSGDYFGALLQYPNTFGAIKDWSEWIEAMHQQGVLVAVATDLLSLTLLKPPGEMGADIVFGSAQRFGVPMGYGGPHAAFLATRDTLKRSLPGRLIGVSQDRQGQLALRMALQTREQHIRREKATSNICTAQVLLAVIASFYAVYHGPEGLKKIARRTHTLTALLRQGLNQGGFVSSDQFFDTLCIETKTQQPGILQRAQEAKMNLRVIDSTHLGVSLDETTTPEDVSKLLKVFGVEVDLDSLLSQANSSDAGIPESLRRVSDFLSHPVFHRYHSETELMRYLRNLEEKDLALNRAMIPLGSCTMKLNASAEMIPVTWESVGSLHPFVPVEQAQGMQKMIQQLEDWLMQLTGFDAISMQPNSGAQGEYAGLLTIRNYHISRGEAHRHICLIPSSAHGTNPASAQMAGMKVVVVNCDSQGNVDVNDLRQKAEAHASELAALMVTYPSTHGVFEEEIRSICDIIQGFGGQVYMDGANLNALVGIAQPGQFGPDVMHFNLHKTFCIPHGGGGPGMGPIGVRSHLAPYLPNHSIIKVAENRTGGAVSAAPWGSPSILPISWMYIRMMGGSNLRTASQVAILNANYVAERLSDAYPILYRGRNGRLAHECILDIRPLKNNSGISEEDIAKRLMDYGFHAPTMSWPVAGTLMIEPTESESREELDRFCEAMLKIREEVRQVEEGIWPLADNPLVNAPHTQLDLTAEVWTHPYSREIAAYPLPGMQTQKFWPTVNRIDNAYGDRNLVCSCPTVESYR
ncbi:MAG: aminomethyl-transferring glycine dehydrogenase [bacterium]